MEGVNIKELRIDNYVCFENKKPVKVTTNWLFELSQNEDAEKYFPIKITEEWLRKLGFKFKEQGYLTNTFDIKVSTDFKTFNGVFFDYKSSGVCYISIGKERTKLNLNKIKYVHELQNLYHSITGEEL